MIEKNSQYNNKTLIWEKSYVIKSPKLQQIIKLNKINLNQNVDFVSSQMNFDKSISCWIGQWTLSNEHEHESSVGTENTPESAAFRLQNKRHQFVQLYLFINQFYSEPNESLPKVAASITNLISKNRKKMSAPMPKIVHRELSKCLCFVPNWHTCVMWRIQCWMWPTPWTPTSSKFHWWLNVIQHPATVFCMVWQLAAMRQLVCICYPNRDEWITRVMLRLSNAGSERTKAEREIFSR